MDAETPASSPDPYADLRIGPELSAIRRATKPRWATWGPAAVLWLVGFASYFHGWTSTLFVVLMVTVFVAASLAPRLWFMRLERRLQPVEAAAPDARPAICPVCLYPREGLPDDVPCPECAAPPPPRGLSARLLAITHSCPPLVRAIDAADLRRALIDTDRNLDLRRAGAWTARTSSGIIIVLAVLSVWGVLPSNLKDRVLLFGFAIAMTLVAWEAERDRSRCLEAARDATKPEPDPDPVPEPDRE